MATVHLNGWVGRRSAKNDFNERKNMNTTHQRMTAIFNEWARRYAENPDEFGEILGADGKPVEDYGQQCALYFEKIADEMDASGKLPRPAPWIDPDKEKAAHRILEGAKRRSAATRC